MSSEKRKSRKYTLRRRAKRQAETRQRIVEAAFDLHATIGPVRTTFSKVAEQAGVQRQTLYAHFPDERSLFLACSAHHLDVNPPPDASQWTGTKDACGRLRVALVEIYAWYERNAGITAAVLRDIEQSDVLREVTELRLGPYFAQWKEALSDNGDDARTTAMLALALSFHTWRTLVLDGALTTAVAAEIMASAVSSTRGLPS